MVVAFAKHVLVIVAVFCDIVCSQYAVGLFKVFQGFLIFPALHVVQATSSGAISCALWLFKFYRKSFCLCQVIFKSSIML